MSAYFFCQAFYVLLLVGIFFTAVFEKHFSSCWILAITCTKQSSVFLHQYSGSPNRTMGEAFSNWVAIMFLFYQLNICYIY